MVIQFKKILLVSFLVISLVLNFTVPAFAFDDDLSSFGAAAVTAAINGTTATTLFTGMGTSAATSSVIGLMDTYAVTTGVAASGTALASTIATGILVAGGTLLVGAAAAALIGGFIDWLREQEGIVPNGELVVFDGTFSGKYSYNGVVLPTLPEQHLKTNPFVVIYDTGDAYKRYFLLMFRNSVYLENSSYFYSNESTDMIRLDDYPQADDWRYLSTQGEEAAGSNLGPLNGPLIYTNFDLMDKNTSTGSTLLYMGGAVANPVFVDDVGAAFDPNPEFQEIPNEIPEGQILSIDTGLSELPQADPQAAADVIMQSAIDGALAPTVSVEPDPTVTPPSPVYDPQITASQYNLTATTMTSQINLSGLDPSATYRVQYSLKESDSGETVASGVSNQIGVVTDVENYTGYSRIIDLKPSTAYQIVWAVTGTSDDVIDYYDFNFTTLADGSGGGGSGEASLTDSLLLLILNKVSAILDTISGGESDGILASISEKLDSLVETLANPAEQAVEAAVEGTTKDIADKIYNNDSLKITTNTVSDTATIGSSIKSFFSSNVSVGDFFNLFNDTSLIAWFSEETAADLNTVPSVAVFSSGDAISEGEQLYYGDKDNLFSFLGIGGVD